MAQHRNGQHMRERQWFSHPFGFIVSDRLSCTDDIKAHVNMTGTWHASRPWRFTAHIPATDILSSIHPVLVWCWANAGLMASICWDPHSRPSSWYYCCHYMSHPRITESSSITTQPLMCQPHGQSHLNHAYINHGNICIRLVARLEPWGDGLIWWLVLRSAHLAIVRISSETANSNWAVKRIGESASWADLTILLVYSENSMSAITQPLGCQPHTQSIVSH